MGFVCNVFVLAAIFHFWVVGVDDGFEMMV
jgi:hypothetical protein